MTSAFSKQMCRSHHNSETIKCTTSINLLFLTLVVSKLLHEWHWRVINWCYTTHLSLHSQQVCSCWSCVALTRASAVHLLFFFIRYCCFCMIESKNMPKNGIYLPFCPLTFMSAVYGSKYFVFRRVSWLSIPWSCRSFCWLIFKTVYSWHDFMTKIWREVH